MATVRLDIDERAVAAIPHSPEARALAAELGAMVARGAQLLAPKDTGLGAASIHGELSDQAAGWSVDVTWDRTRHYMMFHELGTRYLPPEPFLRPALDRYAHL